MRRRKRDNENDDNGFADQGGYMNAKISKLVDQFKEQTKNETDKKLSNIFEGVAIFVNGYTKPSAEELKHLMKLHGGIYHHYQNSATTHIIASILPNVKIKQLGPRAKVVKPSWISDSIQAGKLLDYKDFLLYTNQSETQPKLPVIKTVESQISNSEQHRIRTAVDPNFLSEFYNNSRLHLISTLGAMFKKKITDLRENGVKKEFPAREKLREFVSQLNVNSVNSSPPERDLNKIIMHVDMDCFFVSVGLVKRPHLKGVPIAVTHAKANQTGPERPERMIELEMYKERLQKKFNTISDFNTKVDGIDTTSSMSEIASCSYEARQAGVKNGMFLGTALKICPNLQTIPYDFDEYTRIANILYDTIVQYTWDIEAVSCDEMFVDITEILMDTGANVDQWATFIRQEIKKNTDCACSTGFGSNRLQARLATRSAKPNGQFHLLPENVEKYMADIDVTSLTGVGRSLAYRLKALNLKTCHDLQQISLSRLQTEFGDRTGQTLYDHCRGKDDKPLNFEHQRKSVSAEVNFGIRFKNDEEAEQFFRQLCEEVHSRLTDIKMKGKCITLKLMIRAKDAPVESSKFMGHGLCDHVTKSSTLSKAISDLNIITREIFAIWRKLNVPPSELRGIGIQISRLENDKSKIIKENPLKKFFNNVNMNTEKTDVLPESSTVIPNNFVENSNSIRQVENKLTEINENTKEVLKRGRKKKVSQISGQKTIDIFSKPKEINGTETTKQTSNGKKYQQIEPGTIDEDFLNNLPEDIRLEIIKEYKLTSLQSNMVNISEDNLASLHNNTTNNDNLTTLKRNATNLNNDNLMSPQNKTTNLNIDNLTLVQNNTVNEAEQIDLQFLDELPEDIRAEIIQQYNLTKEIIYDNLQKPSQTKQLQKNEKSIENGVTGLSKLIDKPKIKNSMKQNKETLLDVHCDDKESLNVDEEAPSIMFRSMPWNELKSLIRNWIESETNPKDIDITAVADFVHERAISRKIEFLYTFVKYFHRLVLQTDNCQWHKAYNQIIAKMQEGMLAIYQVKLSCENVVICTKCDQIPVI